MTVVNIQSVAQLRTLFDNADNTNQLIVVDMYGTWCPPCKALAPIFDKFAKSNPTVLFIKVDVDEFESVATQFNITSMPTILFIKNYVELERIVGANIQKIDEFLKKHV